MAIPLFTRRAVDRIKAAVYKIEGLGPNLTGFDTTAPKTKFPQLVFAVRVTRDGGSAGTVSATCSYTYTAKNDVGDFTYGTGLTPTARRLVAVPYTATPDNSWGLGTYDKTGTFVLLDANETPDVQAPCPE